MKASLKFREEKQNPLLRAKVPLNILGFSFQSGVVAGDPKELSLNLSTFFESGPTLKISYRPNDSFNPFSLVIKTGTGPYGSPISSSIHMSAEFNLLGRGGYGGPPLFMLHFKPRLGDFSLKKSQSSVLDKMVVAGSEKSGVALDNDVVAQEDSPFVNGSNGHGSVYGRNASVLGSQSQAEKLFSGIFSGLDVATRTSLPVRKRTMLHFRWGLRVPAEMRSVDNFKSGIAFHRIPFLVMNKIGIEHAVEEGSDLKENRRESKPSAFCGNGDSADAFLMVKRQLEVLQAENNLLRSAVEDLRRDLGSNPRTASPARGLDPINCCEVERNRINSSSGKSDRLKNGKKVSDFNGFTGKVAEVDAHEELKKALKGSVGS